MTLHVTGPTLDYILEHLPRARVTLATEGRVWGVPVVVEADERVSRSYFQAEDGRRLEVVVDEAGLHPVRECVRAAG